MSVGDPGAVEAYAGFLGPAFGKWTYANLGRKPLGGKPVGGGEE
jgi:hypothetical protein